MAGLNCRIGRRVAAAKYKIEASLKTYLQPEQTSLGERVRESMLTPDELFDAVGAKSCLGADKCDLVPGSFGDECKTCKTVQ